MIKLVSFVLPVLFVSAANAQTIFTYGNKAVSKDEFIRAFTKNPSEVQDKNQALKEYLNLYVNFKLKVQAAYDEKLDKDPNQQFELENFKKQIADNVINEEAKVGELVKEAFLRSQKDIHLAQVFVEVPVNTDTLAAFKIINAAYKALQEGKDFSRVTQEFSSDLYTKQSLGDMGFITSFTLPYDMENVAYALKSGDFSQPFRSKIGYHIFKNVGERKAVGTRRVAQILFALPPGHTDTEKNSVSATADSVYNLLQKGASFDEMVKRYSNDISSASNEGILPEFGIGEFDSKFEQIAFSLKTPNEIARPFASNYGYHIIKLIEARPVAADINNPVYLAFIKEKVLRDDRLVKAKKSLVDKHLALIKYKPAVYNAEQLWRLTDSVLANKKTENIKQVTDKTVIFSFAKQNITAGDWVKFVRAMKSLQSELSQKSYPDLMTEYVKITGEEYYKNNLEEYSLQFKQQLKEFKEANMLFAIMDKQVWSKASADTVGLKQYYNKNKTKYQWSESADALVVTCANREMAEELKQKLEANVKNWRTITEAYEGKVTADSGRYDLGQLPLVDKTRFTQDVATAPVKNESDNTYTFNLIIKLYNNTEQRSFEDARGMVISDYQQVLEDQWISALKNKYFVKINQTVFKSLKP